MTSRRSFLIGLGSALAAPAVIRTAGLLMPVRKVQTNSDFISAAMDWYEEQKLCEVMGQELWMAEIQKAIQDAMVFGQGVYVRGPMDLRHIPIENLPA